MLAKVILPANIYHLILSHAYSTENEEIIGMLIGYWETVQSTNPYVPDKSIAYIKYISFLTRSDKRKDRVEIAPESLHLAALQAEEFSKEAGQPMMVIGWYHSHPHITVFPSHVDVRTQLAQQMMDKKFFGIIVSCFNTQADNAEKIQITCFQSQNDINTNAPKKVDVPLEILPRTSKDPKNSARELYIKLPEHMFEENKNEYTVSNSRVTYDIRSAKSIDTSSLPNTMTQLYNAGVYGQVVTSLIDNMIIPATNVLDLKAIELDNEIARLKKYKEKLSASSSASDSNGATTTSSIASASPSLSESTTKAVKLSSVPARSGPMDDFLIQL